MRHHKLEVTISRNRFSATFLRGGSWGLLLVLGLLVLGLVVGGSAEAFGADEPLRDRIDRLVLGASVGEPAGLADDAEVLRRLYLDLTGVTPSSAVTRAYLADADPDKYGKLLDRLLASPEFSRHMAQRLDTMLMERRPDKHIPDADWKKYLLDSVAANKPFHQLAREILGADGVDPALRPAAKFVLDREVEANTLTRDIGRIFFGRDLQCAQCHNHPLIDNYHQADYYGLYAFLNRSILFTDKEKKVYVAEKADGDVNYTSVFTKESGRSGPRLPGGLEVTEPVFPKGEEYSVAPADNVRPVPKYSRRGKLAEVATQGTNAAFNRNIANRLWAMLLGRGLVEPVDLHHPDNPPVHPELLDLLSTEIAAMQFDMKAFLRELASTQTYRRAITLPATLPQQAAAAAGQVAAMEAEQTRLADLARQAREAFRQCDTTHGAARQAVQVATDEWTKADAAAGEAQKAAAAAAQALEEAQKQLAARQELHQVVGQAATKAAEASQKLPEEKELAQATEKFQARAAQLAAEVATAMKNVSDLAGPAKEKADAWGVAQQQVAALQGKRDAARQQASMAEQEFLAARVRLEQSDTALKTAERRLAFLKSLAEYSTAVQASQETQASVQARQTELVASRQLVERLAAELPSRQSELAGFQKAHADGMQQLTAVRQQRDQSQAAVTAYAEVAATTGVAAARLPDDADLQQAVAAVKARHAQLQAELAQYQQGMTDLEAAVKAAAEKLAAAQQAVTQMQTEMQAAQTKIPELESQLPALTAQANTAQVVVQASTDAVAQRWSERFLVAAPQPKTPEQFFWSILQATGVLDNYRQAGEAEVNKTLPIDPALPPDPARLAQRAQQIEQYVYDQLKGNAKTFVDLFAGAAGSAQGDYFATADQALFLANGGVLQSWIAPSGENLAARLLKLEDPRAVAEELYLAVLVRKPTDQETHDVAQLLAARPQEKSAVVQDIIWGLVASAEFRFVQ